MNLDWLVCRELSMNSASVNMLNIPICKLHLLPATENWLRLPLFSKFQLVQMAYIILKNKKEQIIY